ncbi:MAG: hypothetical protein NTZ33_07105 [Bacteroidetes bacterium]|nr:hypothetical protein [Bacteroidota bacterium]
MKTDKNFKFLRWAARIISLPLIYFIGIQLLFPENRSHALPPIEQIMIWFFPIGYFVGLIISWRWDLIGGLLSILGLIVTVIFRPDLFFLALVLSIPADLFILYWFLAKKQLKKA